MPKQPAPQYASDWFFSSSATLVAANRFFLWSCLCSFGRFHTTEISISRCRVAVYQNLRSGRTPRIYGATNLWWRPKPTYNALFCNHIRRLIANKIRYLLLKSTPPCPTLLHFQAHNRPGPGRPVVLIILSPAPYFALLRTNRASRPGAVPGASDTWYSTPGRANR